MVPVGEYPQRVSQLDAKGGQTKPFEFNDFWRIPFSRYARSPQIELLSEKEQKAIRAIKDLISEIQKGPLGLIERKISKCISLTQTAEHMHIAYLLSNLGCRLCGLDYQPEAESVHRRALCMAMRILGRNNPQLATAIDWLAFSLFRQGNLKECILLCYSSMVLTVRHVGTWHQNTANCYSNLATVLDAMGYKLHAESLRYAGRTIFMCLENPYLLQCVQVELRPMVAIHSETSVSHGGESGISSNGVSSGASSCINGLLNEIYEEVEREEMASQLDTENQQSQLQLEVLNRHNGRNDEISSNEISEKLVEAAGGSNEAIKDKGRGFPSVLSENFVCTSEGNKNKETQAFLSVNGGCARREVTPVCKKTKCGKAGINGRTACSKGRRMQGCNGSSEGSEEDFKIGVGLTEMRARPITRA